MVNLIGGPHDDLLETLACHDDVDALWRVGDSRAKAREKAASAGNLKPVWSPRSYATTPQGDALATDEFARHALQVKNIWVPYGE